MPRELSPGRIEIRGGAGEIPIDTEPSDQPFKGRGGGSESSDHEVNALLGRVAIVTRLLAGRLGKVAATPQ